MSSSLALRIISWAWSNSMLAMRGMIIMDVGRHTLMSSKKVDMSLRTEQRYDIPASTAKCGTCKFFGSASQAVSLAVHCWLWHYVISQQFGCKLLLPQLWQKHERPETLQMQKSLMPKVLHLHEMSMKATVQGWQERRCRDVKGSAHLFLTNQVDPPAMRQLFMEMRPMM